MVITTNVHDVRESHGASVVYDRGHSVPTLSDISRVRVLLASTYKLVPAESGPTPISSRRKLPSSNES